MAQFKRYILPMLAVMFIVGGAFALKSKKNNSSNQSEKPFVTEVWIKYDCSLSTSELPVFAKDINNQLIEIPANQAPLICEGFSDIVCVGKLRVTEPGGPQEPLIFNASTGKYEINHLYDDPEKAFSDAFYCE